jgi:two-component system nitrogen regulation response regulator GlnG
MSEIRQQVINQLERQIIRQVIIATQGNKAEAARLLRIDYKTLYRKIHKHVAEPVE